MTKKIQRTYEVHKCMNIGSAYLTGGHPSIQVLATQLSFPVTLIVMTAPSALVETAFKCFSILETLYGMSEVNDSHAAMTFIIIHNLDRLRVKGLHEILKHSETKTLQRINIPNLLCETRKQVIP